MNEDLAYILDPDNQLETIALARALCPFAEQATDAMILCCAGLVEAKGDYMLVAEMLGFDRGRIKPHIQSRLANRIVKQLAKEKLRGQGYLTAVSALIDIAGSESQTGNARNNAAKTLLELDTIEEEKHGGNLDDGKDLNEMTLKELEDMVNGIKAELTLTSEGRGSQTLIEQDKSSCT